MSFSKSRTLIATTAILLALGSAGSMWYAQSQDAVASEPAAMIPQAMPVQVNVIKSQPVRIWKDFSGRIEAVDYAEIRPQVSGTITEIRFEDGQNVNEGDILYVIDPRPYEATVQQAKASLAAAKNEANLAFKDFKRAKGLIESKTISQRIYDERINANNVARANVEAAEAALEQAEIDLDYAFVKAPFTGRVSRAEITEGNLVEAGPNAPILTSVVSNEGVYVDFEVDEQTYLNTIRTVARDRDAESKVPVRLSLKGDDLVYEGFIRSFDNVIDASSGTIRARAYFENEDGILLPGMFTEVKMGSPTFENKILVNEKAIGTNQSRKFVYIVDENNMVTYREISVGESINGQRVILDGLSEGETVIINGIIRVRPNMQVAPEIENASAKTANDIKLAQK